MSTVQTNNLLLLLQSGTPLSARQNKQDQQEDADKNKNSDGSTTVEMPVELMHQCLHYANWGDLAKLASVQSGWSTLMYDTASNSQDATWDLAQALLEGTDGLESNPTKALQLLRQLANVSVTVDQKDSACEPISDNDTSTTTSTSHKTCTSCPLDSDAECFAPAMRKIAECYLTGTGVEADPTMGCAWLQTTHLVGGDLEAAHDLAIIYEYGKYNVEIDVVEAAVWFGKAAEAGHVEAMAELGLCYELGCGVEQSDEKALDWYMKAAEKGHVTSKYSVGEAFEEARGVPQSDEEACIWYHRAAVDGDEDSKRALLRLFDVARIIVPGVGGLLHG